MIRSRHIHFLVGMTTPLSSSFVSFLSKYFLERAETMSVVYNISGSYYLSTNIYLSNYMYCHNTQQDDALRNVVNERILFV